jgi:hypothetical protein
MMHDSPSDRQKISEYLDCDSSPRNTGSYIHLVSAMTFDLDHELHISKYGDDRESSNALDRVAAEFERLEAENRRWKSAAYTYEITRDAIIKQRDDLRKEVAAKDARIQDLEARCVELEGRLISKEESMPG